MSHVRQIAIEQALGLPAGSIAAALQADGARAELPATERRLGPTAGSVAAALGADANQVAASAIERQLGLPAGSITTPASEAATALPALRAPLVAAAVPPAPAAPPAGGGRQLRAVLAGIGFGPLDSLLNGRG